MQCSRTVNRELIQSVISDEKIFRHIGDDYTTAEEAYAYEPPPDRWFLEMRDGSQFLGLIVFSPLTNICFMAHVCLLPCAWGARSIAAFRCALEWMWEHSPALRLIGIVPADNRLALRLALRCGFAEFGLNPRSHMRNGELIDQIFVGVSRP